MLNRTTSIRADGARLRQILHEAPTTRFLVVSQDLKFPVSVAGNTRSVPPSLRWTRREDLPSATDLDRAVFLGFERQRTASPTLRHDQPDDPSQAVVAVQHAESARSLAATTTGTKWVDALTLLAAASEQTSIIAMARSYLAFHEATKFCAVCGSHTVVVVGGASQHCPKCGRTIYPAVSPVVLPMVVCGDECLLVRQPNFPPTMFSCIAGFVEPGESLVEAAQREVFEEVGIAVDHDSVLMEPSQPWPFPSSLMLGCRTFVSLQEKARGLTLDKTELEDARWIQRAEVKELLMQREPRDGLSLPPKSALATILLRRWANI